jgi:hypothetical protein
MKYRDEEYEPDLGDQVDIYSEDYESEAARVIAIGKSKIRIRYNNEYIKPRTEWVDPANCDMISREM